MVHSFEKKRPLPTQIRYFQSKKHHKMSTAGNNDQNNIVSQKKKLGDSHGKSRGGLKDTNGYQSFIQASDDHCAVLQVGQLSVVGID